eukprot:CAMPEP_0183301536 /NCGR_PEP_ID=MMETSP0160_2-20130417/7617_1 /TAXON_ID=2839 ORGANISM="Odontella Sinensis, Strain Grunow 1884" /NCGR_SAMPLE_ID=MMETSP0160_2 /ASSEMBLY_ACC=CAM_ASM_000250 /LENGTH=498 /DNA_ID=CAMNT_0025464173 /DNA_START=17 /DNA_END=1513 /DNA_ORIENTATION=-
MKLTALATLALLVSSSAELSQDNAGNCASDSADTCEATSVGVGENGPSRGVSNSTRSESTGGCVDNHDRCDQWAKNGECGKNQKFMLHHCMKSCAVCGTDIMDKPVDSEPCVDNDERCPRWKEFNQCEKNPGYMLTNCRRSCKTCQTSITSTIDFGIQQLEGGDNAPQVLAVIRDSKKYMRKVMADPRYASVRETCRNGNAKCSIWAAAGDCQDSPIVPLQCGPACQTCDMQNTQLRCPVPEGDSEDVWKPGDLHNMFERITDSTDGSPYAKYNATIISRPYQSGSRAARTWKLGPWFLSFDNFLTDEESARIIAHGERKGFGRSEEVSKKPKPDGSHEILVSAHRTSYNTWCDKACEDDPLIQGVMERIAHLTGIPEPNYESLQVLRYENGQRYGEHADYIPYQKERPCGVRILTLFMYLNDEFEGGETKFRFMHDMKITPKKGKAVLWPNVLNVSPNEEDQLFDHEALPVTEGTKYAANVWLHMRDFKSHVAERCV